MASMHINVSTNILGELSQNVPSVKKAIDELIKNSYDANASSVEISCTGTKFIIEDDGCGMSKLDVERFLTIAKSKKNYNKTNILNDMRKSKGSKGIGFFAAFKIGHKIEIVTVKNGFESKIYLDYKDIIKHEVFSDYDVVVKGIETNRMNGTKITIEELDSNTLHHYNEDKEFYENLYTIREDKEFFVKYNDRITTYSIDRFISTKLSQAFLIKVEFSSGILTFKDDKGNITSQEKEIFKSMKYIDLELILFDFSKKSNKHDVDSLFKGDNENLRPLIYINGSIFDNTDYFSMEENASKSTAEVVRSQIGFINVRFDDIEFNIDRTNLVEGSNQRKIRSDLKDLNLYIQKEGKIKLKSLKDGKTKESSGDKSKDNAEKEKNSKKSKEKSNDVPRGKKKDIDNFKNLRSTYDFTNDETHEVDEMIRKYCASKVNITMKNGEKYEKKIRIDCIPTEYELIVEDLETKKQKVIKVVVKDRKNKINSNYDKTHKNDILTLSRAIINLKANEKYPFKDYEDKLTAYCEFIHDTIEVNTSAPVINLVIQSLIEIHIKVLWRMLTDNEIILNKINENLSEDVIIMKPNDTIEISHMISFIKYFKIDKSIKMDRLQNYYINLNKYKHDFAAPNFTSITSEFFSLWFPTLLAITKITIDILEENTNLYINER